ncbi:MAG: hypothetical protein Q7N50_04775 [Armatimonadota bacterium]|nr:hypothetical protein [Armatimonadota bacterium]
MKKVVTVIAMLAVLLIGATIAANAFTMAEKVVVSNKLVLIARAPAGGFSAEERIAQVNYRLAPILGYEVLTPDNIRLARKGGELGIYVGDKLLTTVTKADAIANGTTVEGLAHTWLRNARRALPEARPYANIYIAS